MLLADFQQDYSPVAGSLGVSAIFAILPLLVLFVLLGVFRMRAWLASAISVVVAMVIAVAVYSMPFLDTLDSGLMGAAFGFFPIMWIVINAIWIYNLTVDTGHFDVLRRSFASISDDQRVQAIIIAFCFGALLEALAGFGTPVAISAVMLIALGFRPIKAAAIALVANTAPVAFGALAVPIITLSGVTSLPVDDLGAMVGRQTPILAVFVPLALVFIVDGRRGLRQMWPPALVCGVVFGVFQYLSSNFWSVPLADIVAALASALAVLLFTRVWHAPEAYTETSAAEDTDGSGPVPAEGGDGAVRTRVEPEQRVPDTRMEVFRAYAPYLVIIVIFVLATRIPAITGTPPTKPGMSGTGLESATQIINWPGLHIINEAGKPVATTFKLNYLSAAGTLLLISGLLTLLILRIRPGRALRAYGRTLDQLKFAILTVMLVLALGFVMNQSGQTTTLPVRRGRGRALRAVLAAARLARCGGHRLGHVVELAVRAAAGHRGAVGRSVADADGGRELLRWRARQDDLAAEPGDRRRRGGHARQGGRPVPPGVRVERRVRAVHVPARVPAEHSGAGLDGGRLVAVSRLGSSSGVASSSTPATAIAARGPVSAASRPHTAVKPAVEALPVTDHAASTRATRSAGSCSRR